MINKDNKEEKTPNPDGLVDVAHLDVQCHILIKDKDTGEILLNKRG